MSYLTEDQMNNVVNDLLNLLHEDWLPEKRKEAIRNMLMDIVDKMSSLENERWQ